MSVSSKIRLLYISLKNKLLLLTRVTCDVTFYSVANCLINDPGFYLTQLEITPV